MMEEQEKALKEVLEQMSSHSPLLPDALIDYYLQKAGFQTDDIRMCVLYFK
jgi:transcription initiation factor TFIID subunit 10